LGVFIDIALLWHGIHCEVRIRILDHVFVAQGLPHTMVLEQAPNVESVCQG
jgi:hypothetical protein